MASRPVALRFLSGRHRGAVVPLDPARPVVLGRGPGADLVIGDEAVSRRHARLAVDGDGVAVEDLGSTNGTYVNGERAQRARLAAGDRLLVGGSIARVLVGDAATVAGSAPEGAAPGGDGVTAPPGRTRALQGHVEEIPLVDVLQLCATTRKTGRLVVENAGHRVEVTLHGGRISGATLDGRPDAPPEKCLYRILGWTAGRFELTQHEPAAGAAPRTASAEGVLLEAMRQLDELRRLRPTLPARVAPAAEAPPGDLSREERVLVALAAADGAVDAIVDAAPQTDLEAAQGIAALVARGVLVPAA